MQLKREKIEDRKQSLTFIAVEEREEEANEKVEVISVHTDVIQELKEQMILVEEMKEVMKMAGLGREKDMVVKAMENKLTDNISKGARKDMELHQLKGILLWRWGRDEERMKFMNMLRDRLGRKRTEVRKEHKNQSG